MKRVRVEGGQILHEAPAEWPRWVGSPDAIENLREVGPRLFVGSEFAPAVQPPRGHPRWALVVDLCGARWKHAERYQGAGKVLAFPFKDGTPIPQGALERIVVDAHHARKKGPVLIHCAAGLSRSTSVAYAILRTLDELDHEEALARVKVHPDYPMQVVLDSARLWVQGVYQEAGRVSHVSEPGHGITGYR